MEREEFVAVDTAPWWLLERDLDFRFEDLRRRLGASFGWTDPTWYTERIKLEEVHAFLLRQGGTFFYDLQQASDDYRREQWVESVIAAKSPSVSTLPSPDAPASRSGHPVAGPEEGAAPRPSPFGAKSSPSPSSPAADPAPVAPVAVRTSPFAAKGQPQPANPARQSVFGARRQSQQSNVRAPRGPAAPRADAAVTTDEVSHLDEQIKTVMSELSADDLAAIAADLGVSLEEVEAMIQDDDFAGLVAEEQTQLAS